MYDRLNAVYGGCTAQAWAIVCATCRYGWDGDQLPGFHNNVFTSRVVSYCKIEACVTFHIVILSQKIVDTWQSLS